MLEFEVLYDFISGEPGELSVRAGEVVRGVDDEKTGAKNDGWVLMETAQGEVGYVPASYVEELAARMQSEEPDKRDRQTQQDRKVGRIQHLQQRLDITPNESVAHIENECEVWHKELQGRFTTLRAHCSVVDEGMKDMQCYVQELEDLACGGPRRRRQP